MAVHDAIPLLFGELVDWIAASQTRVVDQNVQTPEGLDGAEGGQRTKDRFLAVLSHESRNPLAAIRTALHILKGGSFSEIQQQRVGVHRQSVSRCSSRL
jgi:signal transduction histidine kinase